MRRMPLLLAALSVAALFASDALAQRRPGRAPRSRPQIDRVERPGLRERLRERREAAPQREGRSLRELGRQGVRRGLILRGLRQRGLQIGPRFQNRPFGGAWGRGQRGGAAGRQLAERLRDVERRLQRLERAERLERATPEQREVLRERLRERRPGRDAAPGTPGTPGTRRVPTAPSDIAPDRAELRKRFDRDGDGTLNEEERAAAREALRSRLPGAGERIRSRELPPKSAGPQPPAGREKAPGDRPGPRGPGRAKVRGA